MSLGRVMLILKSDGFDNNKPIRMRPAIRPASAIDLRLSAMCDEPSHLEKYMLDCKYSINS
jgi:hypothetical protein